MYKLSSPSLLQLLLLGAVVLLILGALTWRVYDSWHQRESPPWFGRGRELAASPQRIITGPIWVDRGIEGLLALGMERTRVVKQIGQPLVAAMPTRDAQKAGFIDPEDVSAELFGGLFAWTRFDSKGRVLSLKFDLEAFSQQLHGEQVLYIREGTNGVILSKALPMDDTILRLRAARIRVKSASMISGVITIGRGTVLEFDGSGKLQSLVIFSQ